MARPIVQNLEPKCDFIDDVTSGMEWAENLQGFDGRDYASLTDIGPIVLGMVKVPDLGKIFPSFEISLPTNKENVEDNEVKDTTTETHNAATVKQDSFEALLKLTEHNMTQIYIDSKLKQRDGTVGWSNQCKIEDLSDPESFWIFALRKSRAKKFPLRQNVPAQDSQAAEPPAAAEEPQVAQDSQAAGAPAAAEGPKLAADEELTKIEENAARLVKNDEKAIPEAVHLDLTAQEGQVGDEEVDRSAPELLGAMNICLTPPLRKARHIMEFQVVPKWQSRGVGSALMRYLRALAAEKRWTISLCVQDANRKIKDWYENRWGFKTTGYGNGSFVMRWRPSADAA